MRVRNFQCSNCGYLYNTEHPYYSEDFATAILSSKKIAVSWCLHCNYISEYRPHKYLGIIPTSKMKLKKSFHLKDLNKQEYFGAQMDHLGGLFGFHVHRMIWHAIDKRARLIHAPDSSIEDTLYELLNRVPPLSAAVAILAVSNTAKSVSLEDQIELGIYQNVDEYDFRGRVMEILEPFKDWPNQSTVMQILSEAPSG